MAAARFCSSLAACAHRAPVYSASSSHLSAWLEAACLSGEATLVSARRSNRTEEGGRCRRSTDPWLGLRDGIRFTGKGDWETLANQEKRSADDLRDAGDGGHADLQRPPGSIDDEDVDSMFM